MNDINQPLKAATVALLQDLQDCLQQLTSEAFTAHSLHLSGATIGQHLRHVIELYTSLLAGYHSGLLNYDLRKRDIRIETDRHFAADCLQQLQDDIVLPNKPLLLQSTVGEGFSLTIDTNYERELLYNLEHAIHHMALMRVGIQELTDLTLPGHFGVAPSTLQHRKEAKKVCVH